MGGGGEEEEEGGGCGGGGGGEGEQDSGRDIEHPVVFFVLFTVKFMRIKPTTIIPLAAGTSTLSWFHWVTSFRDITRHDTILLHPAMYIL